MYYSECHDMYSHSGFETNCGKTNVMVSECSVDALQRTAYLTQKCTDEGL